jgi:hypothetical protein
MKTGQLTGSCPVARSGDVTPRAIELARVTLALVLARREGFGARSVVLAPIGPVLRRSESRHGE